jgi:hypothetical protein
MANLKKFKENMLVSYKDMVGTIVCMTEQYFTFNPKDSNAVLLVYKSQWNSVTVQ